MLLIALADPADAVVEQLALVLRLLHHELAGAQLEHVGVAAGAVVGGLEVVPITSEKASMLRASPSSSSRQRAPNSRCR